ncbi:MAG: glucose-6-phosphate dehydrogenase [Halothiobacillaceae bacterium]|nr:glucose-6-phosphate dehydrogenase [Halothiobacillaceae bacterium]
MLKKPKLQASCGGQPFTIVIFGATGNLACNKLLPALFQLDCVGKLPDETRVMGFGRREWRDEDWRAVVAADLHEKGKVDDEGRLAGFLQRLHFHNGDLNDEASFLALRQRLDGEPGCQGGLVFYFAVTPEVYAPICAHLATAGLTDETQGCRRVVVEKPFGHDIESAHILDSVLHRHFTERQIFRIDHYLGKGTVQNIMVLRFANLLLEPLWNRNYIDHVQISHSETAGIGRRGGYYDGAGALRDMIQSHLLQMLALIAMEPPPSLDPEAVRDEKVKVLRSIRPISPRSVHAHAFRAQYARGTRNGQTLPGYLDEEGIPPNSTTETYSALKLYIDNWRWRGVPFYLRTGKAMTESRSQVSIRFRHPPQQLFRETPIEQVAPNWLLIGIQPNENLRIEMQIKTEGLEMRTRTTQLDASYTREGMVKLDAYGALLLDVLLGDQTLFLRYDEVEWAWRVVDPILKTWSIERDFIYTYPAGSWGPDVATRLFDSDDHFWRNEL